MLVNKKIHDSTALIHYRNLSLYISSQEELKEHFPLITEGQLRHCRILKLVGRMPSPGDKPAPFRPNEEYRAEFGERFSAYPTDGPAEVILESWKPLVALIKDGFQHISDFIWVCQNKFPSCLLDAMEQHQPYCRLHLRTFWLHRISFRASSSGDDDIDDHEALEIADADEQQLIRSPLLHSITVRTVGLGSNTMFDCNYYGILLATALAPNLKHLNITKCHWTTDDESLRHEHEQQSQKQHLALLSEATKRKMLIDARGKKGKPVSLIFAGDSRISVGLKELSKWAEYVDLSYLRYLNLGSIADPRAVDFLVSEKVLFTSLETLGIQVTQLPPSKLESLINRLEPLKDIRLTTDQPLYSPSGANKRAPTMKLSISSLKVVVQRHGPTLRRLTLDPVVDTLRVRIIQLHCLQLEYLKITVPHSAIYAGLVENYKLARLYPIIPSLRELVLIGDDSRHRVSLCGLTNAVPVMRNLIKSRHRGSSLRHLRLFGWKVS